MLWSYPCYAVSSYYLMPAGSSSLNVAKRPFKAPQP